MWRYLLLVFPLTLWAEPDHDGEGRSLSESFSYYFEGLRSIWQSQEEVITETCDLFEEGLEALLGEEHLFLFGYYPEEMESGVIGRGEVSDKVRVTGMNGMLYRKAECYNLVQTLSDLHGGVNVHYTYWPSKGWTKDLVHCALAKSGLQNASSRKLAEVWKRLIEEMGGVDSGGVIHHYCHSIGCSSTEVAKNLLTKEEQKMIRVLAFGPATIIENEGFGEVMNYISVRDGVSLLDPVDYVQAVCDDLPHVKFVGDLNGPPLIDHTIINGIYMELLQMLGSHFQMQYGSID